MLGYILFKALGIDFAAFWAVLLFLFNYIPSIGSIIASIFPIVITIVQYGISYQFGAVAVGLLAIQFIIGNILEPTIMGSRLNLSPLVIIVSLMLWGNLWGLMGMFLCIPLTIAVMIILAQFPSTKNFAIILSGNGEMRKR